jgi:hypothetical protein
MAIIYPIPRMRGNPKRGENNLAASKREKALVEFTIYDI